MTIERSHLVKSVLRKVTGAPTGGSCTVYEDVPEGNTTSPTAIPLYSAPDLTNASVLPNPFTFTNGQVDFYTQYPVRLNIVILPTPVPPATTSSPAVFLSIDAWPSAIDVAISDQGLLANRPPPTPHAPGFRYFATDIGQEYYSTGTAWVALGGSSGGGLDTSFLLMGA
jgi:hypothetical protein